MSAPELPTREDAGFLAGLAARIHAVLMGESARDNLSRSDDERLEAIAMRIATPPAEPPAITDTMRLAAWKEYALHLEGCGRCAEIGDCPTGSALRYATRRGAE